MSEKRNGFWLKKNNYLEEYNIENVYAGFMPNVKDMTDEMIQLAQKGKLAYLIPKRYWRKK